MKLSFEQESTNDRNLDVKGAFQTGLEKQKGKDINERYADRIIKEITNSKTNKLEISPEQVAKRILEDLEKLKELSPEKVKVAIIKKLEELKNAILEPVAIKLYIFLVHGWDAAFGPKPKPQPQPQPQPKQ